MELDLTKIREEIDKTDRAIVEHYHRRMELVEQVAAFKLATGKPVLDREREEAKLRALEELAKDEFDRRAIREIFEHLMALSRKMQQEMLAEAEKAKQ